MEYFNKFTSNTLAASGNQTFFYSDNSIQKSRVFYKVFSGGEYEYSFLFTNILDSTFADGSHSQKNYACKDWLIKSARVYIADKKESNFEEPKFKLEKHLLFNGNQSKNIISKEIFYSDPLILDCEKNDYICLELEFQGEEIPYLEEIIIPSYRFKNGKWTYDKKCPLSCMVGASRSVKKRIGFIGDSITEGIGTPYNSYSQWNACIAELLGEKYSYWNLGIGFGRADDAGTNGVWLEKAKQMDAVTVCFGVNDICQGFSVDSIKFNLNTIVDELKKANCRVILFTVPPFNFEGEKRQAWYTVNEYIKNELSQKAEIYDTCAVWCSDNPNDNIAKYGGHPDKAGCMALAKDFVSKINL